METPAKKRLGASVALLFLSPALAATLSGCNNGNCDNNRSTATTSDDCGTGGRSSGIGRVFSGGRSSGGTSEHVAPRSGGFGGFGRMFSSGG